MSGVIPHRQVACHGSLNFCRCKCANRGNGFGLHRDKLGVKQARPSTRYVRPRCEVIAFGTFLRRRNVCIKLTQNNPGKISRVLRSICGRYFFRRFIHARYSWTSSAIAIRIWIGRVARYELIAQITDKGFGGWWWKERNTGARTVK